MLAAGGLLLVFGMWWIYFKRPAHSGLRASPGLAFAWGYGHYAVFAAVAALGAGCRRRSRRQRTRPASERPRPRSQSDPVAVFLVLIGVLQTRLGHRRFWMRCTLAAVAVIGLAAAALALPLPVAVVGMGLITAVLAALDVVDAHRRLRSARAPVDRGSPFRRYAAAATPERPDATDMSRSIWARSLWDGRPQDGS